jgi:very-short-patch-repair endonuclease
MMVNGFEVDAHRQRAGLVVELDGFAHHRTRAAFEHDRLRDAALQVAGYRVPESLPGASTQSRRRSPRRCGRG